VAADEMGLMDSAMRITFRRLPGSLLLSTACCALASEYPPTLADCAGIADGAKRLACFDRLAADTLGKNAGAPTERPRPMQAPAAQTPSDWLTRHWELEPAHKQGTFIFRPHQDNYVLLANYSSAPNEAPFSPFKGLAPEADGLQRIELKYQLGFKMKLLEDIAPQHADLWFGYTQTSNWQAYNRKISSPFRDTNYQPELMGVVPVDFRLLGMRARFLNIGLAHQSNGQSLSLSRSWNRIYTQLGMEKGNLTLLARVWKEVGDSSDNPDISDYMGHGDIGVAYRWKGQEFFMFARGNLRTGHGAIRAGWAFPLVAHLKGYVEAFSGYGQTLIDYNHSQTTIGIGVLVSE
jgi:phospholipase A1